MAKVILEKGVILEENEEILIEMFDVQIIRVNKRITSGMSGASVFSVMVENPSTISAIIKLQTMNTEEKETDYHKQAIQLAEKNDFGDAVPRIIAEAQWEDTYGAIYQLAGDSTIHSSTLNELLIRESSLLKESSEYISRFIYHWNRPYDFEELEPIDLIELSLGRRMTGPKIKESFESININKHNKSLVFEGYERILPNPYAFISEKDLWEKKVIKAAFAKSHGDLHGNNIIVSPHCSPTVIDFGEMQKKNNIFYDARYLEIHLLLDYIRVENDFEKEYWNNLCESLTSDLDTFNLPDGKGSAVLANVITPLRGAISNVFADRASKELYAPSYFLAGVAAGLNFFRKTEDMQKAMAALLYTAMNLKSVLEHPVLDIGKFSFKNSCVVQWSTDQEEGSKRLYSIMSDSAHQFVLVVGPHFLRYLGYRSEGSIIAEVSNGRIHDDHNSEAYLFDKLLLESKEPIENIKLQVATLSTQLANEDKLSDSIRALVNPRWQAVLNWGISSVPYELAVKFSSTHEYFQVTHTKDLIKKNRKNSPWFQLRGESNDAKNLELGKNSWTKKTAYNKRSDILNEMFSRLEGTPTFLILGFADEELEMVLDELKKEVENSRCLVINEENTQTIRRMYSFPQPEQIIIPYGEVLKIFESISDIVEDEESSDVKISITMTDGNKNLVQIPLQDYERMSRYLEILNDGLLGLSTNGSDLGRFYLGHPITWEELKRDFDISREITESIISKIRDDLSSNSSYRLNLFSESGAGASTISKRIAWDIFTQSGSPVVIIKNNVPDLMEYIRTLYGYFQRSFLVIADEDYISVDDTDRLFSAIQGERISVVMLRVVHSRAFHRYEKKSERTFLLRDKLNSSEITELQAKLKKYVDESKWVKLDRMYDSILLNMLNAFEQDFIGLDKYVHDALDVGRLISLEKIIIENLAICSYFTKGGLSSRFIASSFNLNNSGDEIEKMILVEGVLGKYVGSLFVDKDPTSRIASYASRHDLITEKILEILIGSQWRVSVGKKIIKIINNLPSNGPGSTSTKDFCYSLVRAEEGRTMNLLGKPIRVSWLAEILNENSSDLKSVYECCAEKFPEEAHLKAHLARYYYEFTDEYELSRDIIRNALEMVRHKDSTINQMMGMTFMREIQWLTSGNYKTNIKIDLIKQLYNSAGFWFQAAWSFREKDDHKAYGAFVGLALHIARYGTRTGLFEKNDEIWYGFLTEAKQTLDEAKFYLEYEENSYLGDLEFQLKSLSDEISISKLREMAFDGKPGREMAQKVYFDKCYREAIKFHLGSDQRDHKIGHLLNELDQLRKEKDDEQYSFLWARTALRLKKPPLEKIESLLIKLSEESLRYQFYLMCVQFMLMLEKTDNYLYTRYQKTKQNCIQMSSNIPWRTKRKELIGLNMQLVEFFEVTNEEMALKNFSGFVVQNVSPTQVRTFMGFPDTMVAIRQKTNQQLQKGDRLNGYIGFTFDGPRLFLYERE